MTKEGTQLIPTVKEAEEIAFRFINGHFKNAGRDRPRMSIPADPMRDDDIRLLAFIRNSQPTPPPSAGAGTETPEIEAMSDDSLVELYQQISSRVAIYNAEVLIQRMFELRKAIVGRLSSLRRQAEADRATIAGLKAEVERLRGQERSWLACYEALSKTPQWEQTRDRVYAFGMKHAVDTIALLIAQLASADKDRERLLSALIYVDRQVREVWKPEGTYQQVHHAWAVEQATAAITDAAIQPSASLDHEARGTTKPIIP